jgi:hypothetical protein
MSKKFVILTIHLRHKPSDFIDTMRFCLLSFYNVITSRVKNVWRHTFLSFRTAFCNSARIAVLLSVRHQLTSTFSICRG